MLIQRRGRKECVDSLERERERPYYVGEEGSLCIWCFMVTMVQWNYSTLHGMPSSRDGYRSEQPCWLVRIYWQLSHDHWKWNSHADQEKKGPWSNLTRGCLTAPTRCPSENGCRGGRRNSPNCYFLEDLQCKGVIHLLLPRRRGLSLTAPTGDKSASKYTHKDVSWDSKVCILAAAATR